MKSPKHWDRLDKISLLGLSLAALGYLILDGAIPHTPRWIAGLIVTALAANLWGYVYSQAKKRAPTG